MRKSILFFGLVTLIVLLLFLAKIFFMVKGPGIDMNNLESFLKENIPMYKFSHEEIEADTDVELCKIVRGRVPAKGFVYYFSMKTIPGKFLVICVDGEGRIVWTEEVAM